MKSLTEYIIDSLVCNNNKNYEWNNNLFYTFEEFCEDNNINIENTFLFEDAYDFYKNHHWIDNSFGEKRNYEYFQNYLYETLLNSYNGYKLIEKLKNEFNKDIIRIEPSKEGNPNVDKKFFIDIHSLDNKLIENKEFIALLNSFNYYVLYCLDNKEGYEIRLRPHFADEKTNDVYKDKYIYHLSEIKYVDKILKYGLEPKAKHDSVNRIYILRKGKNFDNQIQSLIGKETKKCLFTIDLSKTKNKLRFFLDEGATGYYAYYTLENIPKECLIKHEMIYKQNKLKFDK